MSLKTAFILLLVFLSTPIFTQNLDIKKLDQFFVSLEKRNEAMGSITISKQGKILYDRVIGHRYISEDTLLSANTETKYRIWSISKIYTAVMILQLVEEGKLSLKTTLDQFYPQIPNAEIITIENMLRHKSGIHDFIQNDTSEDWDAHIEVPLTHEYMVQLIASYDSDFPPSTQFQYSNSNYLLLGYIIEKIDNGLYEHSLSNRISSRIGLTDTYFSSNGLDHLDNKAFSYQYSGQWNVVEEGIFSGPIPAGAGGILATTKDLAKFIEALFTNQLISKESLQTMIEGKDFYQMGIMKTQFEDRIGYGHTGGYIASESSLFYYPQDSLTIAYCTNGIVLRKEDILDNVLKVYHHRPFGVSMNRNVQGLLIWGIGWLFFFVLKLKFNDLLTVKSLLFLGYLLPFIFWTGVIISGLLYGNYSHQRDGITLLDSFYSNSGSLMAGIQFVVALLGIPCCWGLYRFCKKTRMNFFPILPLAFLFTSMLGASLFPFPNSLNTVFVNLVLLTMIAPLLGVILWRTKASRPLRIASFICLCLMFISSGLLIARPSIPAFVGNYFGWIQRLFYISLTLWLIFVSVYFLRRLRSETKLE